jgi:hypothetical protein
MSLPFLDQQHSQHSLNSQITEHIYGATQPTIREHKNAFEMIL